MSTLVEQLAGLVIGSVESVSPNEFKVALNTEAPQSTALNTGVPSGFPRINSYVLVPNESGAVVGLISWVGVERSPVPRRDSQQDSSLVDLPFPVRRMALTPVGTLLAQKSPGAQDYEFQLHRGISVFPCVGDQVFLPTAEQMRSIIEAQGHDRRLVLGTSPLAGGAFVSVDPDKLFGRHLAVLGNTGSGKSCSVAGLVRWSLEVAQKKRSAKNLAGSVNARFIILDPNGEYLETFADLKGQVRVFKVPPVEGSCLPLSLPAWMWNSQEWTAFAGAAPQTQRPLLLRALRDMRAGMALEEPTTTQARRLMLSYRAKLEEMIAQGVGAYSGFPASKNCGNFLSRLEEDGTFHAGKTDGDVRARLEALATRAREVGRSRHWKTASNEGYNDFSEADVRSVLDVIQEALAALPKVVPSPGPTEDAPIRFDVGNLPDHLQFLASSAETGNIAQFVATLAMRIRMMLADRRLGPLVMPEKQPKFAQWLENYIGADEAKNGPVAILDLSLVPSDVLHIAIAVIARVVFEAAQRYKKLTSVEFPTVLVLEEAHTFIRSGSFDEGGVVTAAQMCRHTFERIAREGRKFGLGLVLSSQRPSELSATVLAQCNTFILHRIVNDRDQELVKKLVPDALGGLLRELPSLPTRQAIILGWATPMPVILEINELPEAQRPRSADPSFWSVWTGESPRRIDWDDIVKDWIS